MTMDQLWAWCGQFASSAWWLHVWAVAIITTWEAILVLAKRLSKMATNELLIFGFSWAILIVFWFN